METQRDTVKMYLNLIERIDYVTRDIAEFGSNLRKRVQEGKECDFARSELYSSTELLTELLATLDRYEQGNYD